MFLLLHPSSKKKKKKDKRGRGDVGCQVKFNITGWKKKSKLSTSDVGRGQVFCVLLRDGGGRGGTEVGLLCVCVYVCV